LPIKNFKVTHLGDRGDRGNFMIQIILNSEQEKLLQQLLETGKYTTHDRVITDALKALSEKQHLNQPRQVVTILSGKHAQELLAEKIKMSGKLKNSDLPDPHRQALAENFSKLCEETQALHADRPLTDEEIAEEIAAYRSGE
jgi:Arc/MetJ-type ribon-helix-helix transcriptional regulator